LQPNSRAIGQKHGEKWAAAVDLQPAISKSDSLLGSSQQPRLNAAASAPRTRRARRGWAPRRPRRPRGFGRRVGL